MAGPARLAHRHPPLPPLEVEVHPAGIHHLALAGPGQDQHGDDERQLPVAAVEQRCLQAPRFLRLQIALAPVVLLEHRQAQHRVAGDTGGFPGDGQVEQVAQDAENTVAGGRRQPLAAHDFAQPQQPRFVDVGERQLAERPQQVIAQIALVDRP